MEIKTKFGVGDNICTIDSKTLKIRHFKVCSVIILADESGVNISYTDENESFRHDLYDEKYCFSSQEEIINYISSSNPTHTLYQK